jgi:hypothetical protein
MAWRDAMPGATYTGGRGALHGILVDPVRALEGLDLGGHQFVFAPDVDGDVLLLLNEAYDADGFLHMGQRNTQPAATGIFFDVVRKNLASLYSVEFGDEYATVKDGVLIPPDQTVDPTNVPLILDVPIQVGEPSGVNNGSAIYLAAVCPQLRIAMLTSLQSSRQATIPPVVNNYLSHALKAGEAALAGKYDVMFQEIDLQWSSTGGAWAQRLQAATDAALAKLKAANSPLGGGTRKTIDPNGPYAKYFGGGGAGGDTVSVHSADGVVTPNYQGGKLLPFRAPTPTGPSRQPSPDQKSTGLGGLLILVIVVYLIVTSGGKAAS